MSCMKVVQAMCLKRLLRPSLLLRLNADVLLVKM